MIEVFRMDPGEVAGLEKVRVVGSSIKKERVRDSFHDIDYVVIFSNGEELKLRLTPPEPFCVTQEDYDTYGKFQKHFGPGPVGLAHSGIVRLLRGKGVVVVGFAKRNRWAVRVCV